MEMKILSLPSRHPYTAKINSEKIKIVNSKTDYFSEYQEKIIEFIKKTHSPNSYDIVHIHFSFDKIKIKTLGELLKYFKSKNKMIVWTIHSRESQRLRNLGNGRYQKLLWLFSDSVITLTQGCKDWIQKNFGNNKKINVIPHGYIANPGIVKDICRKNSKEQNMIVYLVGEFRENKEYVESIIQILQCGAFKNIKLKLIFKPIQLYSDKNKEVIDQKKIIFWNIIKDPRVEIISLPEISNEIIFRNFAKAHTCILPYKWGTHSGQIELARDFGCNIVASNVGFYKEQSKDVIIYGEGIYSKPDAKNFTEALIKSFSKKTKPISKTERVKEHNYIIKKHEEIYSSLIKKIKI